jgi:hypothetical protein
VRQRRAGLAGQSRLKERQKANERERERRRWMKVKREQMQTTFLFSREEVDAAE